MASEAAGDAAMTAAAAGAATASGGGAAPATAASATATGSPAVTYTLETLPFDNLALRSVPIDPEERNFVRSPVRGAVFSLVEPSPVSRPSLVASSQPALDLVGLDPGERDRDEFAEYMSGNKVMPGARPAAHCYCGHQFGYFAGQLGDGATMYQGEVVNAAGERWELQHKGAGKTPYSRTADGRKVMRSSVREFLCSEANHFLGVPTTRAASVVTSDTRIARDQFYNGDVKHERCSVIVRIAPSFLRFGSFEIFKAEDPITHRAGPSAGLATEMLPGMLDYTIGTFFPDVAEAHRGGATPMARNEAFFRDVVRRTAHMVATWQCVGFCHGVINTDNMSILGLTIDYGPFGFMDRFDPDFVCNNSDDGARYTYATQPEMCRWNCEKLFEALSPALPDDLDLEAVLKAEFDAVFERDYVAGMRRKLGLVNVEEAGDEDLVADLLDVMHKSGADFPNTFRILAHVPTPGASDAAWDDDGGERKADGAAAAVRDDDSGAAAGDGAGERGVAALSLDATLARLQDELSSPAEMAATSKPAIPLEIIPRLLQRMQMDPHLMMQADKIMAEIEKTKKWAALKDLSPADKTAVDMRLWREWLARYRERLAREVSDSEGDPKADAKAVDAARVAVMMRTNPKYVLRNHVAQAAITAAQRGDFSEVQMLVDALSDPYELGTRVIPPSREAEFTSRPRDVEELGLKVS